MSIEILAENLHAALLDLESRQRELDALQAQPESIPNMRLLDRAFARLTACNLYIARIERDLQLSQTRPFGR